MGRYVRKYFKDASGNFYYRTIDGQKVYQWGFDNEVLNSIRYGYRVYLNSVSATVERIGSTLLHQSQPINSQIGRLIENDDGSVNYYLGEYDSRVKQSDGSPAVWDGTDGNIQLLKPGYYFKLELGENATGAYVDRWFSTEYIPGYTYRLPRFISPFYGTIDNVNNKLACVCSIKFEPNGEVLRDGNGLPVYAANAAQYRGGNNSTSWDADYRSFLGMARTSLNRATLLTYHSGSLTTGAAGVMGELAQLFTLEYGTYNAQLAYNAALDSEGFRQGGLGSGTAVASAEWSTHNGYNPFVPNGVTMPLGNKTGVVNYSIKNWQNSGTDKVVTVSSWRGFENWFEYLWVINTDHLFYHQADANGGKVHLYVCEDYTKLSNPASDETDGLTETPPEGYNLRSVNMPTSNGYGLKEVANSFGDMYPESIGGGSTTGLCDYYYRNAADRGWFAPLLAGLAHLGSAAGVRNANTNYRVSLALAYAGFRLCRHNPDID